MIGLGGSPLFLVVEKLPHHRFSNRLWKTLIALLSLFINLKHNSSSLQSFITSLPQPIENSCGELELYHS